MNLNLLSRAVLSLVFFSIVTFSIGQSNTEALEETQISILTIRSGDELYSTFGHTAIRIFNPNIKVDHVYNYGLFSFDTPNFYPKFMRGQLPYYLGKTKMSWFLTEYNNEKRSVIEQKLNLSPDKKQELISFLEDNAKPENREYRYDFFYDNCATRVVDVYAMVSDSVIYNTPLEKKTFRDLLKENLKSLPWSDFGIDIVIGERADKLTTRRHQMFLPEYLMNNLASVTAVEGDTTYKLSDDPYVVLDFEELNESRKTSSFPWPFAATIGILVLTFVINLKKSKLSQLYNKTLLVLSGVLGLFLLLMWFGTNHGATRDNWNVIWLNPLFLVYLLIKRFRKDYMKYILIGLLSIAGLNCLYQFLPQFFHLAFLPLILSFSIALENLDNSEPKYT